jgi:Ca-activated chloride channel family protein
VKALEVLRKFRIFMLILGGLCLSCGIYQKYWYADLVRYAVESIEANRLDQQYLEEAKKGLFSSDDLIDYNMGVRAYRANNLKKAGDYFHEVIRNGQNSPQKKQAYFNLGNILVQFELPRKAAEMYKESLRLDPNDWESKYNLERLYVFQLQESPGEGDQASLKQEPGKEKEDEHRMGRYHSEKPDI